ncbi:hypothetical protein C6A37_06635, partial [Desulfobacteraceae bacterium SEEP-SAG9]
MRPHICYRGTRFLSTGKHLFVHGIEPLDLPSCHFFYLFQHTLLSREGEVEIAKRIEAG